MIPIHDDNPTHRIPVLTILVILVNVAVFVVQSTRPEPERIPVAEFSETQSGMICRNGVVPDRLIDGKIDQDDLTYRICALENTERARATTLVTHQFVHGDWLHLVGNLIFLWVFGNNVEDRLGRLRFLPFFLLCGIIAALGQVLMDPGSGSALIGASGAISGVLGAYLLLFPRARVLTLVTIVPLRLPAWVVLGAYMAFQFLFISNQQGGGDGVAYGAHIVGFIAGALLIRPFLIGRPPPRRRSRSWGQPDLG